MKSKLSSRILSMLLCLVMCISLFPVSVLAENSGNLTETIEETASAGTVEPVAEAGEAEQTVTNEAAMEEASAENTVRAHALPISIGQTVNVQIAEVNERRYYSITPEKDALYTFRSSAVKTAYDTECDLEVEASNGMEGYFDYYTVSPESYTNDDNNQFTATYSLTAGNTYYLAAYIDDVMNNANPDALYTGDDGFNITVTAELSNVTWALEDGVLTIDGSGPMSNYGIKYNGGMDDDESDSEKSSTAPWAVQAADITSIVIGDNVTSIGAYAFSYLDNLRQVTIGENVTQINRYAFAESGDGNVITVTFTGTMPAFVVDSVDDGMDEIYYYGVFSEDKVALYTPDDDSWQNEDGRSNAAVGAKILWNGYMGPGSCGDNLTWTLDANGLLTITGSGDMTDYSNYTMPWYGYFVTTIALPEGLTHIGAYAFYNSKLTEVTVPSTVTSIGIDAFANCYSLKTVTFTGAMPLFTAYSDTDGMNNYSAFAGDTVSVYYPTDDDTWQDEDNRSNAALDGTVYWNGIVATGTCGDNLTWILNADGVLTISGTGAMPDFEYDPMCGYDTPWAYSSIRTVVVEPGVTNIGEMAFCDCPNLTSVSIPASVTDIANNAFEDCPNLTAINVEENNEYYASEDGVLFNKAETVLIKCPAGKQGSYTIPDGVISIGDSAFYACEGLTDVTIPASVTEIGDNAFAGCSQLSTVKFLGNAPAFHDDVFSGDTNTIRYPENSSGWTDETLQQFGDDVSSESYTSEGTISWTVTDADTEEPLAQISIMAEAEDGTVTNASTDSEGHADFTLKYGTYIFTFYADDYNTRSEAVTVNSANAEKAVSLQLSSILSGEITCERMTDSEIQEAGIDATAAENQQWYRFRTELKYNDGLIFALNPVGRVDDDGNIEYYISGTASEPAHFSETYTQELSNGDVCVMYQSFLLVIEGEAHWTKEMFKVKLLVGNTSNSTALDNTTATLELPEGLSLAKMAEEEQSASVEIGTLEPGSNAWCTWYVRGDQSGDYDITAVVKAQRRSTGATIQQSFKSGKKIHVYAGDALKMIIMPEFIAVHNENYHVKYRLVNTSDIPIYNMSFEIDAAQQYELDTTVTVVNGVETSTTETKLLTNDYYSGAEVHVDELDPNGYIEFNYATTIAFYGDLEKNIGIYAEMIDTLSFVADCAGVGIASTALDFCSTMVRCITVGYYLTDAVNITLAGSTTEIPYEFEVQDNMMFCAARQYNKMLDAAKSFVLDQLKDKIKELLTGAVTDELAKQGKVIISTIVKDDEDFIELFDTIIETYGDIMDAAEEFEDDLEFAKGLYKVFFSSDSSETINISSVGDAESANVSGLRFFTITNQEVNCDGSTLTISSEDGTTPSGGYQPLPGAGADAEVSSYYTTWYTGSKLTIHTEGTGEVNCILGIADSDGNVLYEYPVIINVDDYDLDETTSAELDGDVNIISEENFQTAIDSIADKEGIVYRQNPYIYTESVLEITLDDLANGVIITKAQISKLLDETVVTSLKLTDGQHEIVLNRDALTALSNLEAEEFRFGLKLFSTEDAAASASDDTVWQLDVLADGEPVTLDNSSVTISVPVNNSRVKATRFVDDEAKETVNGTVTEGVATFDLVLGSAYIHIAAVPDVITGDVNNDTIVDLRDLLVLKKALAEGTVSQLPSWDNANMNGDSEVNLKDLLILKRQLAG